MAFRLPKLAVVRERVQRRRQSGRADAQSSLNRPALLTQAAARGGSFLWIRDLANADWLLSLSAVVTIAVLLKMAARRVKRQDGRS